MNALMWFVLEALLATALLLGIVWWTWRSVSGRGKGDAPDREDRD